MRFFLALVRRLVGAVFGFFSGALIGCIAIILAMVLLNSTFGLRNISGPVFAAAIVGALVGACFPRLVAAKILDACLPSEDGM